MAKDFNKHVLRKKRRFEDMQFKDEHPVQSVAEHEVFMSFKADDDATSFYEWWNDGGGAELFQEYLENR